ncbi:MAG: hypothetical protein IBX72_00825 [Nitrospirae bacterium]|nr:hypothetical protein [Nitrospirota bacterium]
MKRVLFLIFIVSLLFLPSKNLEAASMSNYCVIPPYVIQDIPPNVMIVLDNSGSMLDFAYFDGFTRDDCATVPSPCNRCTNPASPCTGFEDPGTYPNYKYYGYFNPDYWYTYGNNRFSPTEPKIGSGISGSRVKLSTEWDGNFLNWLTMRRVDVVRKVLAGGKSTGAGENTRLLGQIADYDGRGIYKQIANANTYTPYNGNKTFTFSYGGSATSSFSVSGVSGTFSVIAVVPPPVEGVIQRVVGTRARLGLSFYRANNPTPQGGFVQVNVDSGSLSSVVNQINNDPSSLMGTTNTPLAETLWTVTGYFAQQATMEGGPGPRYNSGDFQINNNNDPYNYGTGGNPRWEYCSKSFVLYITDGEPCADGYLPATLRDYASGKSEYNCSGTGCPAVGPFPASTFPSCTGGGESASCGGIVSGCYVAGIEDIALYMHTTDLRSDIEDKQKLTLFTVFAFGKGSTLLKYASINGGFEDMDESNTPNDQSEWAAYDRKDKDGNIIPDNYFEATDGYEIERAVEEAFSTIIKRAASGTAASVLASGEGSGANLVQAVFYPRRIIGNYIVNWIGENHNFWYYVDPFFSSSSIREDTVADRMLNLTNDHIVQLYFDQDLQRTMARRFADTDGDGDADNRIEPNLIFENVLTLWKAGKELWSRDISVQPRTIYTTIDGSNFLSGGFSTENKTTLIPYLQAANDIEAEDIIRYIHGEALTTLKDFDEDGNPVIIIEGVDRDGDGIDDYRPRYGTFVSETNVWKLGDILNSTPRITSWIPLNNYDSVHNDLTYKAFLETTGPDGYKERGMIFAGGNDGMLHAFKLGKLELKTKPENCTFGNHDEACLSNPAGYLGGSSMPIGHEMWAFLPKNSLPYLKYLLDPEYCHVYTVDLSPYIFDASINSPSGCASDYSECDKDVMSWKTILIGGMRTGGACKPMNVNCSTATPDSVCAPAEVDGSSVGYSSYFALDITDQNNPQLLWEFSHPQLGFTTTGPAIVRIGQDKTKNGKWFVVFGSGPTGPINTTHQQFLGRSDQNLRFFVLDLKTGALLRTIDTGIQYAFAGSMLNVTTDSDLDYQDDAIYVGYVKRTGSGSNISWTEGGIGRIFTKENDNTSNWVWRVLRDNTGPVTSAVAKLQSNKRHILWLYFGTGRYFYEIGSVTDDPDGQRGLFGIKEPCFTGTNIIDPDQAGECQSTASGTTGLTDVTSVSNIPSENDANSSSFKGWFINLDATDNYTYCDEVNADGTCTKSSTKAYRAERVITDPLAATTGLVFFTTYKPYNDVCGIGGKSFIWAVRYTTGGPPGALLKGIALLQVSTGSIEQVDLSSAFTQAGGRKTSALEGVPPTAQGLSLLSTPPPVKRVIHMRER